MSHPLLPYHSVVPSLQTTKPARSFSQCDLRHGEPGVPSIMRIAPVPLYNTFRDVFRLVTILREVFDHRDSSGISDSGSDVSGGLAE